MFDFISFLMKKKRKNMPDENVQQEGNFQRQIIVTGDDTRENKSTLKDITVIVEPPIKDTIAFPLTNEMKEQSVTEFIEDKLPAKQFNINNIHTNPKQSFSNNISNITSSGQKSDWFIVTASAIGKSHLQGNIPCQDNHYCESINEHWGIAISCDGAGSAANSHIGSAYVATEIGAKLFKDLVVEKDWHQTNNLPTPEEWRYLAREVCIKIYNELDKFAGRSQVELNSLACTIIVVIYSPVGLLVTHIGDGRAGYCNEASQWKSIITPHKGEEANQTIFITSNKWITDPTFLMSGKNVPESNIIREKAVAFTLMSDGCELHSFECSMINTKTNKWYDPNEPYPKFFNPLVKNLKSMNDSNTTFELANDKWIKFIEAGTNGLETEPDDKTMILGIIIKKI
jgi:Protein phosphatase 2C